MWIALFAVLAAASAPRKLPNMPRGWTWPPSATMKRVGTECLARLDAAAVDYRRAKPIAKIATPIVLPELAIGELVLTPLKGKGSYPMDCQLAAGIAELLPGLRALGIRAIRFRTLHEYRTVRKRNRKTRILSRHAIGLAVDVFGLELDDGSIVEVERDWSSAEVLPGFAAVFATSPRFRTPLTPANDPGDHGDHIHLEAHMRLE